MTIGVDATAPGGPLKPVWSFFGYDEANYTTTAEGVELLETLGSLRTSPVYTRTHFLFNSGDGAPTLKWGSTNIYTEDATGTPIYDYALIDGIMDVTTQSGVTPLFELGFMPQALSLQPEPYQNSDTYVLDSGAFYPPTDYGKWEDLVAAWARHVRSRYASSHADWIWELWNEPDIGYWKGSFEEYSRLYDHTERALHAVLPDAQLGGPAVARPDGEFLRDFLEHCERGTNAVSGEIGTRLDFVTFHAKGGVNLSGDHVQMNLGAQLRGHEAGFQAVASSPSFAESPIIISEADPDGCAACPASRAHHLDYRNSPAYGAYVVAMMKHSIELAERHRVDLRGVLTWAFTFPGTPYFEGYRALSTNGIFLPVLNAFRLLDELQGVRLPVTSNGQIPLDELLDNSVRGEPDIDALATLDGDDRINILVWHYHDDLPEADLADSRPVQVTLDVALPPAFQEGTVMTHQRVDQTHGNAFTTWQLQGRPSAPTPAQLEELRDAMHSLEVASGERLEVVDGTTRVSFALPRFGLSLVTLSSSTKGDYDPPPVTKSGCSCRVAVTQSNLPIGIVVVITLGLVRRRLRVRNSRSATLTTYQRPHPT